MIVVEPEDWSSCQSWCRRQSRYDCEALCEHWSGSSVHRP